MRILVGVGLLLMALSARAVSESSFVYGYSLEVDGDGAVYSLVLPEAVYHGLTRADRGDLRVFNSEGIAVPYHIMRADKLTQKTIADVKLPIFPLYVDSQSADIESGDQAHIVTDDNGRIIDINYGRLATTQKKRISAYLLDCSQLNHSPNALIINWPASMSGFVVNVEVDGSDDLSNWQPVIVRKTLSDLKYDGHVLIQQRIDLPLHQYKYLRLNWLQQRSLQLESVEAEFPATYQSQDRQWSTFKVTDTDRKTNSYYFDTHSVLPADRVNIDLANPGTLVDVSLASAESDKGPWRVRYHGLLYNLHLNGDDLTTPAQVMKVNTDRYWRLRVLSQGQELKNKPLLRLGWVPEILYFIAQGEAPFTLAYGSARVGPSGTPLKQLLAMDKLQGQQQFVKPAQLGPRLELGNSDNLEPAGSSVDWQKSLLWLVLILAVVVIAVIVIRKHKQP